MISFFIKKQFIDCLIISSIDEFVKFYRNLFFELFKRSKYFFDFIKKLFVILDENDDDVNNKKIIYQIFIF